MSDTRTYDGARVYYVFTFLWSRLPFSREVRTTDGLRGELGEIIEQKLKSAVGVLYDRADWHQAEETEESVFRSALYTPFHHLSITTTKSDVKLQDDSIGKVSSHIAVFESGLGMAAIRIDLMGDLSESVVARLVRRDTIPIFAFGERLLGPHQFFELQVTELLQRLNLALGCLDSKSSEDLYDQYPNVAAHLLPANAVLREIEEDGTARTERAEAHLAEGAMPRRLRFGGRGKTGQGKMQTAEHAKQKRFQLHSLDDVPGLLWTDKEPRLAKIVQKPDKEARVWQEPSVILMLRVDPAKESVKLKEKAWLASINRVMHGVTGECLDPSHQHVFRNLYPEDRFTTVLHENCLLVLHAVGWESDHLDRFFGGLFRTFVALRGSWHFYTVTNELLDLSIRNVYSEFRKVVEHGGNGASTYSGLLPAMAELIFFRGEFLRSQAIEDPLVRSIGMTPFGELFDEGQDRVFRLGELRQLVSYKIGQLDRIFEMADSYTRRSRFEPRPGKDRGFGKAFWWAGGVLVAGGIVLGYLPKALGSASVWWSLGMASCLAFGAMSLLVGCALRAFEPKTDTRESKARHQTAPKVRQ